MIPAGRVSVHRPDPNLTARLITRLSALSDPAFFISERLHDLIVAYINSSMVEIVEEDVSRLQRGIGRQHLPAGGPEAVTHIAGVRGSVRIGSGGPVAIQHQGAAVIIRALPIELAVSV